MTWKLEPLQGKYYGTRIVNDWTDDDIVIWLAFQEDCKVSDRELERGWDAQHGYDHVESQRSYEAAMIICEALNEKLK